VKDKNGFLRNEVEEEKKEVEEKLGKTGFLYSAISEGLVCER